MLLLRETIRKKQHKITKRMKLHAFLRAECSTYFHISPNIYLIKINFFSIDNKRSGKGWICSWTLNITSEKTRRGGSNMINE